MTDVAQVLFQNDGEPTVLNVKLTEKVVELFQEFRGLSPEILISVIESVGTGIQNGDVITGEFQGSPRSIPLDIYTYAPIVPLDNVTIPESYKEHIQELREIYMFDRNLNVYICSTVPSIEIHRITQDVVLHDHDISDELKEEIYDWWDEACRQDQSVDYTDAYRIEALIQTKSRLVKRYGTPVGLYGETYDELWEQARESIQGNCLWG